MFVTRTAFIVMESSRDAAYRAMERLQRELDRERERGEKQALYLQTLVQTIVDMRRQTDGSFSPKPQRLDPLELSHPIDDAISERAQGNAGLRRHLLRHKAALQASGKSDEEIIHILTNWQDPERDD